MMDVMSSEMKETWHSGMESIQFLETNFKKGQTFLMKVTMI